MDQPASVAIAFTIDSNCPMSSTLIGLSTTASLRAETYTSGSGSTLAAWLRGSGL